MTQQEELPTKYKKSWRSVLYRFECHSNGARGDACQQVPLLPNYNVANNVGEDDEHEGVV